MVQYARFEFKRIQNGLVLFYKIALNITAIHPILPMPLCLHFVDALIYFKQMGMAQGEDHGVQRPTALSEYRRLQNLQSRTAAEAAKHRQEE